MGYRYENCDETCTADCGRCKGFEASVAQVAYEQNCGSATAREVVLARYRFARLLAAREGRR